MLLTIRVCGPDSAQAKRALERQQEEMLARGALSPLTRSEEREADARLLARFCMGWTAKDREGQPIPFAEDGAFDLFVRYPLIRQAVDQVATNRSRFLPRSSTGSAAPSATA